MNFVLEDNGIIKPITGNILKDDIVIPFSSIILWTEQERNSFNIYTVEEMGDIKEWQTFELMNEYQLIEGKAYQIRLVSDIDIKEYKNKMEKRVKELEEEITSLKAQRKRPVVAPNVVVLDESDDGIAPNC